MLPKDDWLRAGVDGKPSSGVAYCDEEAEKWKPGDSGGEGTDEVRELARFIVCVICETSVSSSAGEGGGRRYMALKGDSAALVGKAVGEHSPPIGGC